MENHDYAFDELSKLYYLVPKGDELCCDESHIIDSIVLLLNSLSKEFPDWENDLDDLKFIATDYLSKSQIQSF